MPDRIREMYAAIGNDPFLIQECIARPALVDRLTRGFFAYDTTIHAEEWNRAKELRRGLTDAAMPAAAAVTVSRGELGERAVALGGIVTALRALTPA